jgi:hypothetical protein
MLQKGREAKKVILFFETQNFLINSFNCRFLSSIAQKADRKNWSPATRQRKLEKSRIAKKVHFQFCAFLFFDLNKCVTGNILKTHKEKTGSAGQAATLAKHRVNNARPDVIAIYRPQPGLPRQSRVRGTRCHRCRQVSARARLLKLSLRRLPFT